MNYETNINLLLESLSYFGRKAQGKSWTAMQERIFAHAHKPSSQLIDSVNILKQLTERIDETTDISDEKLQWLFGNLEGFPHNTIGTASRAFFLLYACSEHVYNDPADFQNAITNITFEEVLWGITSIFEDDLPEDRRLTVQHFNSLVLALHAPDSTKIAILELAQNYQAIMQEALHYLLPVIEILRQNKKLMIKAAEPFFQKIEAVSQDEFFSNFSHLRPKQKTNYIIRPFILGADTNLTYDIKERTVCIYSGILRHELTTLVSNSPSDKDRICEIYRVLGDPTRFDIFCFLITNSAYVQELSSKFNLSRNTIHHNLNKLMESGLIQCTPERNRMKYAADTDAINNFIQLQQDNYAHNK